MSFFEYLLKKTGLPSLSYRLKRKKLLLSADTTDTDAAAAAHMLRSLSPDPCSGCIIPHRTLKEDYDLEIVIPCYNVEKYLQKCLDSVLNQKTDYRFHVTCVDDGSTDGTAGILKKYVSRNNLTVLHQQNGGLSAARNAGLSVSRGRYIMFVDSDDYLPENSIQRLLEAAYANSADIVEGARTDCFQNGVIFRRHSHVSGKIDPHSLYGTSWGKIYRRELFESICFPVGYWYEDSVISQILLPQVKTAVGVPDSVYVYRMNRSGIIRSGAGNPKTIDALWITLQLHKDRHTLGLPDDSAYYAYILMNAILICFRTRRQPEAVRRAVFTCLSDLVKNSFAGMEAPSHPDLALAFATNNYELYAAYCAANW